MSATDEKNPVKFQMDTSEYSCKENRCVFVSFMYACTDAVVI